MIPLLLFLFAAGDQAAAQIAPPLKVSGGSRPAVSGVAPTTVTPLERRFNDRLATLFDKNDPLDLLGTTRGVYLDGFGAVFTADLSLVVTPAPTPFRGPITKEMADAIRQKKVQRLPFLRVAMKEMMRNMAGTFIQVPEDQQMVLVVRFYYEPWEDMNGMPSQILMRASRREALAGDVKVQEQ